MWASQTVMTNKLTKTQLKRSLSSGRPGSKLKLLKLMLLTEQVIISAAAVILSEVTGDLQNSHLETNFL